MENKLSFAYDDERSTYTEGESKSRRSSILKPPKARAPLQEVNLGGAVDDTEEFDTLRKRRVSFAGVNSVKEFCSQAESAHVGHIQSYEETFSTSSDGSHNSTEAKSLQDTPKAATTTSFVDKNFVDDPMDLTDSNIEPILRKPDPTGTAATVPPVSPGASQGASSFTSNMSLSSTVDARTNPPKLAKEEAKLSKGSEVAAVTIASSSCSMDMTEPVQKIRPSISEQQPSLEPRGFSFKLHRNSIKVTETCSSDSGMEFTEAIPGKFGAFSPYKVENNLGDVSMEMTEVVRRDGKFAAPSFSSTNKSASMDFTGIVRNEPKFVTVHPQNANFLKTDYSGSGMELTQVKSGFGFAQSVKPDYKETSRALFDNSIADKSVMQSPCADQSLCEMEMTGVLSLSKYHRVVSSPEAKDMDFTHLMSSTKAPAHKHARLSIEPEDEPLPFPSRFDLEQQPVRVEVGSAQQGSVEKVGDHVMPEEEKKVEEDEDTIALNFNRKQNSPVELSFLKEFRDSPEAPVAQPPRLSEKPQTEKKLMSNEDHILLFSMSRVVDDINKEFIPAKNDTPKDCIQSTAHNGTQNKLDEVRQSLPATNVSDMGGTNFSLITSKDPTEMNVEPLRGMQKSQDPVPMRVSFKDFEIKADNHEINESLSTVGLDDSRILKAGFNDLTRPDEQVPSVSLSSVSMSTTKMESSMNIKSPIQIEQSNFRRSAPVDHTDQENLCFMPDLVGPDGDTMKNSKTRETSIANPEYDISVPIIFNPVPDKSSSEANKTGQSFRILEVPESPGMLVEYKEAGAEEATKPEVRRPRKSMFPVSMFYSSSSISSSQQMELTEARPVKQPEDAQSTGGTELKCNSPAKHSILDDNDMELSLMDQTLMKNAEVIRSLAAPCSKKSLCNDVTLLRTHESYWVPGTEKATFAMEDTRMAELSSNTQISRQEFHAVSIANEETHRGGESSPSFPVMDVPKSSGVSPLAIDSEETFAKFVIAPVYGPDNTADGEMEPTVTATTTTVPLNFKPVPNTTLVQGVETWENQVPFQMSLGPANMEESFPVLECDKSLGRASGEITVGQKTLAEGINLGGHQEEELASAPADKSLCIGKITELDQVSQNAVDIPNTFVGNLVSVGSTENGVPLQRSSMGFSNTKEPVHKQSVARRKTFAECLSMDLDDKPNLFPSRKSSFYPEPEKSCFNSRKSLVNHETFGGTSSLDETEMVGLKSPLCQSPVNTEKEKVGILTSAASSDLKMGHKFSDVNYQEDDLRSHEMNMVYPKSDERSSKDGLSRNVEVGLGGNDFAGGALDESDVETKASLLENPVEGHDSSLHSTSRKSFVGVLDREEDLLNRLGHELPGAEETAFCETGRKGEELNKSEYEENPLVGGISHNMQLSRKPVKFPFSPEKSTGELEEPPSLAVPSKQLENEDDGAPKMRLSRKSCIGLEADEVPMEGLRRVSLDKVAEDDEYGGEPKMRLSRKSRIGLEADEVPMEGLRGVSLDKVTEGDEDDGEPKMRLSRKSCIGLEADEVAMEGFSRASLDEDEDAPKMLLSLKSSAGLEVDEVAMEGLRRVRLDEVAENDEGEGVPKTHLTRKSCIELEVDELTMEGLRRVSLDEATEDIEFAVRRNKRKSTVGLRDTDNVALPEGNLPVVEHVDIPRAEVVSEAVPEFCTQDDDQCANLSQEVMNISLDADVGEEELMCVTSTPCKTKPTCDKRKRISKSTRDMDHNLSQEMMNISIESDTRSPMPKKPPTWSSRSTPAHENPLSTGSSLINCGLTALSVTKSKATSNEAVQGDLPYEVRVKNSDFMKSRDFTLICANTYQMLFFETVLGLKVVFPPVELSEKTEILDVRYTFYPHKIGRTCLLHREIVDFFKRRLFRNQPEEWIRGECRTVRDLDRIVSCLKQEVLSLIPLIKRLTYVKMTEPCKIIDDRLNFTVVNTDLLVKFDVSVYLRSSHEMRDGDLVVNNATSKIDEKMVRMIYRTLSPTLEMYTMFAEFLTKNTSKLLVR